MDPTTRQSILNNLSTTKELPVSTAADLLDVLKEKVIRQSMDGKSRWADNIMIERWFRSFKYEEAYLTQYRCIKEARNAIRQYVKTYNFERCHSAIDYKVPAELYFPVMLYDAAQEAA